MNATGSTGITGITGIDAITYSTERWDEARTFFADWGLACVSHEPSKQVWQALSGAQVIVYPPDAPELAPAIEAGPTLREVTWGVVDATALERLVPLLRDAPHFADQRNIVAE